MATFRFAAPDDADAISQVHVATWRSAYRGIIPDVVLDELSVADRAARWRKGIEADPRMVQVAESAGSIVGWVASGPCHDDGQSASGEVFAIYILKRASRRGIGAALLNLAEAELTRRGYGHAKLWVLELNVSARAFYAACGYSPDGARKTVDFGGARLVELRYSKAL